MLFQIEIFIVTHALSVPGYWDPEGRQGFSYSQTHREACSLWQCVTSEKINHQGI